MQGPSSLGTEKLLKTYLLDQDIKADNPKPGIFQSIFEQAGIGIAQLSPETGQFIQVNQSLCDCLGYSEAELLGMTLYDITHQELSQEFDQLRAVLLASNQAISLEKQYITPSGLLRWAQYTLSTLSEGTDRYTLLIFEDITSKKIAEQSLQYCLELESLLTGISTEFLSRSIEDFDVAIQHTLEALLGFTQLDRIEVGFCTNSDEQIEIKHCCANPRLKGWEYVCAGSSFNFKRFTWFAQYLQQDQPVLINSWETIPTEAVAERDWIQTQGLQSLAIIPLLQQDTLIGVILLASIRRNKVWIPEEITGLLAVADIITGAWVRKQTTEALQRRLEFEHLLTELSSHFINVDINQVNILIGQSLQRLQAFLKLDRSHLYYLHQDANKVAITYEWQVSGIALDQECPSNRQLPWISKATFQRLTQIEPICFTQSQAEETWLNPEQVLMREEGIQLLILLPVAARDKLYGILALDGHTPLPKQYCSSEDLGLLMTFCHLLATTLSQKQTAEALSKSEMRYRALVENQIERICRYHATTFQYIDANRVYRQQFGLSAEADSSHVFPSIMSTSDQKQFKDLISALSPEHPTVTQECLHQSIDGTERWYLWTHQGLFSWQGHLLEMLSVGTDITARKQLEQQKDEFIAVASHELRTPLFSMKTLMTLLLKGNLGTLSPQGQKLVEHAAADVVRLEQLVNDLLDLERLKSNPTQLLQYQECVIADLLAEIQARMLPLAQQSQVELHTTAIPGTLWADPDRMRQILINLVDNAIKFSPPQTQITLSVTLSLTGHTLWQVHDQGPGIPLEKQEIIFEPFQQADGARPRHQHQGSGLGLAICKQLVKQHGGQIWVESESSGCTFKFTIPGSLLLQQAVG